MRPDHKKGREHHHEINKVIDDRCSGKIDQKQMSRDIKTLKDNIKRDVVNPMKGRPPD